MNAEFVALIIGQLIIAVGTIATVKADMRWIKRMLVDHENRLRAMEGGKRKEFELSELGI